VSSSWMSGTPRGLGALLLLLLSMVLITVKRSAIGRREILVGLAGDLKLVGRGARGVSRGLVR
jgi:hypothetical protein